MRRRLFALLVVLVVAVALITVSATGSSATGYKGDVDYWGALTVSIDHNQVTALQGRSGGIPCAGPSQINPVLFSLSAPVPVVNGKFHAQGTALDDYRHPIQWSLDASISVTRTILGTVSLSGPPPIGSGTCSRTFRVAAIIPRRARDEIEKIGEQVEAALKDSPGRTAPDVNFDFRHGVITHFSARATTMCGQSVMGARLYSTAYHLDPIQVNGGRFRIVADVLDDYSVHSCRCGRKDRGQDGNGDDRLLALRGSERDNRSLQPALPLQGTRQPAHGALGRSLLRSPALPLRPLGGVPVLLRGRAQGLHQPRQRGPLQRGRRPFEDRPL